jgi:hypothetical protein
MAKIVSLMQNTAISYRNRRLIAMAQTKQSMLKHELFILSIMRCCQTPF